MLLCEQKAAKDIDTASETADISAGWMRAADAWGIAICSTNPAVMASMLIK